MVGVRSGDAIALGDRMEIVIEDVAILRRSVYGRRLGAEVNTQERGRKGKRFQAKNIHASAKGTPKKGKKGAPPAGRGGPSKPEKQQRPGKKIKKKERSKRRR